MKIQNASPNPSRNKKRQAPRADFHDYKAPGYYHITITAYPGARKSSINMPPKALKKSQQEQSLLLLLSIRLKRILSGMQLMAEVASFSCEILLLTSASSHKGSFSICVQPDACFFWLHGQIISIAAPLPARPNSTK